MLKRLVSLFLFGILVTGGLYAQTNYYNTLSATDPTLTSSWTTDPGGGAGSNPTNFTSDNQVFNVRLGTSLTATSAWNISGLNTALNIFGTLTASGASITLNSNTNLTVAATGVYNHNTTTDINTTILACNTATFQTGSTFSIGVSGTHTAPASFSFSEFRVSGSSQTVSFTGSNTLVINNVLNISATNTLSLAIRLEDGDNLSTSGTGTLSTSSISTSNLPTSINWTMTVNYTSASAQRIQLGTYQNLNASGGNRTIQSGVKVTINGTFTPGSGTYTLNSGSTIEFAANGPLNIPNLPYQNLTISGTGTKTMTTDLTIAGALVINNSNADFAINGNTLTLNGSGSTFDGDLLGSSTSNLVIGGTLDNSTTTIKFHTGSNILRDLTLNRTGANSGVTLGSDLTIARRLTLTNGRLNLGNQTLTLQSTSISNTAQVAAVGSGASVSYGSLGGIRIERYIPSGNRAYRDLSSGGVYTDNSFVYDNWQESGATTAGIGTHITGLAGSGVDPTTGLDRTATGSRSMHTYISAAWGDITNTRTTRLDPYRGYRILIRGDRNANITTLPTPTTMNRDTRLRATGKLIYGDITFNTGGASSSAAGVPSSGNSLNNSTNGYSLVANPFPAIVDWHSVYSASTNIQPTYWYFDPTIGTTGAYVTYSALSQTNDNGASNVGRYLQPGMGFFTQTSASSPVLRINEAHKALDAGSLTNIYESVGGNPNVYAKLRAMLLKQVSGRWINMDGTTLVLGENFSNSINNREDAAKLGNGTENLCIVTKGSNLSIDARQQLSAADTIQFRIWQTGNGQQYQLILVGQDFHVEGILPFLEDRFLQTFTYVRKDTMVIPFTVTADASSSGDRFRIVFRKIRPSGVQHGVKLEGQANAARLIQLQWAAGTEQDMLQYEVEKSIDGNSFYFVGKKSSSEARNWTDMRAATDKTWYRIKQLMLDGTYQYSNMAYFGPEAEEDKQSVRVYPNPYKGGNIQLMLFNIPDDQYQLSIIDALGKQLSLYTFTHKGTQSVQVIPAGQLNPVKGVYQLQISGKSGRWTTKLIVD